MENKEVGECVRAAGYSSEFNRCDDSFTQFLTDGYFYCCFFFFFKNSIVFNSRKYPPTGIWVSCSSNLDLLKAQSQAWGLVCMVNDHD